MADLPVMTVVQSAITIAIGTGMAYLAVTRLGYMFVYVFVCRVLCVVLFMLFVVGFVVFCCCGVMVWYGVC